MDLLTPPGARYGGQADKLLEAKASLWFTPVRQLDSMSQLAGGQATEGLSPLHPSLGWPCFTGPGGGHPKPP